MRRHSGAGDPQKFIDEIRAKQRNIVFPDGLANGAAVDKIPLEGFARPSAGSKGGSLALRADVLDRRGVVPGLRPKGRIIPPGACVRWILFARCLDVPKRLSAAHARANA
jgi:hypothetical protein